MIIAWWRKKSARLDAAWRERWQREHDPRYPVPARPIFWNPGIPTAGPPVIEGAMAIRMLGISGRSVTVRAEMNNVDGHTFFTWADRTLPVGGSVSFAPVSMPVATWPPAVQHDPDPAGPADRELAEDIREFLLRAIREHEEEWLAIEAESLLRRLREQASREPWPRSALGRRPGPP